MSQSLNILYFGPISGTCLDRANAYRRLGHTVHHIDPRTLLPRTVWVDRIMWRAGGHWFAPWVLAGLRQSLQGRHFDLCHVDSGEWFTASAVELLRAHAPIVINYNVDDPTGPRDRQRFAAYWRGAKAYDLLAVVREDNLPELAALGARHCVRVHRSADEVTHAPRALTPEAHARWDCDVLFLGTWMPERGPFLLALIRLGVPLTIQGSNWQKAPEWPELRTHWRGDAIGGDDYAKAIQCARVNLGLLSKGNRDLHTTRSLEIPSLGALFCAERTVEHSAMYEDGLEAVLWGDASECAAWCHTLLADEPRRHAIAQNGHARYLRDGNQNQVVLQSLLREVGLA